MKKLFAYIQRYRTGKCGTLLYYNGCNCIDCQKLQKLETQQFYNYINQQLKYESNL